MAAALPGEAVDHGFEFAQTVPQNARWRKPPPT